MTRRTSSRAVGLALILGLVVSMPISASAGTSSVAFNHRCGWWNDWCNGNTTTTTTAPPPTTTTTTAPTTTTTTAPTTTTTTAPPTTTTTKAPATTTSTAPTTTTTTTTTTTSTTLPPVKSTNTAPPSTTTTTVPSTTTTTSGEAVGFYADFDPPRSPAPQVVTADTETGPGIQLLVSLAGAFVGMTVEGLGYYLFVFLVPVLAAIWLTVVRRREDQESA